MTEATARDYWISATALYIELNALGDPDYIQASCVNDTKVLAFMKGIAALDYDAGHNYRRWSLQASPTVFNSHSEKYVYIAIPRDPNTNRGAFVAFPSEKIDLYGLNAAGEQIGSISYYYVFTQGVISSSGTDGGTARKWLTPVNTGTLSSDEAVKAATGDGTWWEWNAVSNCVKFLKDISEAAISTLTLGKLKFNGSTINGVANDSTAATAGDALVTPGWGDAHYLSSVSEDTAAKAITFAKGAKFGEGTDYSISETGAAKIATAAITDGASNGDFVSGYAAGKGWSVYSTLVDTVKKWTLEIDNLVVRSAMKVYEMVVSQLVGENDNRVFAACGEVVRYISRTGVIYISTEGGGKLNPFRAGDILECQRFGTDGTTESKHYRLTVAETSTTEYGGEQVVSVKRTDFKDLSADGTGTAATLITAGDTLVRVDSTSDESRKGIVAITSVGGNTPYLDVMYGKVTDAANSLKVRLGNLAGVVSDTFGKLSGWGLYAENAYLKGKIYAESGTFNGTVNATSGTFTNGTFTDCSVSGTLNAENCTISKGKLVDANVSGSLYASVGRFGSLLIGDNGRLYTSGNLTIESPYMILTNAGVDYYNSMANDGSFSRCVRFGLESQLSDSTLTHMDGLNAGAYVYSKERGYDRGIVVDLENYDSTDTEQKAAIMIKGGSIEGFRLRTALLNGGSASAPTEIPVTANVAILRSGGAYMLPDLGTATMYDGQFVMLKVDTLDEVWVYSRGDNRISVNKGELTNVWNIKASNPGLSATLVFVPGYNNGVWMEFKNSWGL